MMTATQRIFCVLSLLFFQLSSALKFDIQAHPGSESEKKERCIRNFVARDTLVVVTVTVDGSKGDGQVLNMHVRLDSTSCANSNTSRGTIVLTVSPYRSRTL